MNKILLAALLIVQLPVIAGAQQTPRWMVSLEGGAASIHDDSFGVAGAVRIHRSFRNDLFRFDTGYMFRPGARDSFNVVDAGMELHACVNSRCSIAPFVGGGGGILWESDFAGEIFRGNAGVEFKLGERNVVRARFQGAIHGGQGGPHFVAIGFGHRFGAP